MELRKSAQCALADKDVRYNEDTQHAEMTNQVRAPHAPAFDPKYLNPSVQRIVLDMETESTISIVGQFCLTPDGQRVIVEKVGAELDSSRRAIVRRVEGPKAGTRSTCFVSSLKPLGFEIPLE